MASRVAPAARRLFTTTARRFQEHEKQELQKETKKNPELLILGGVMTLTLAGAGLYFGRSPTSATSEAPVLKGGNPWDSDTLGKYKYHPGGDPKAAPRDAPSALNSVVVPNVKAPAEQHEQFNKWGKEGF